MIFPFKFSVQNFVCISHIAHASNDPLTHLARYDVPNSFMKSKYYEAPHYAIIIFPSIAFTLIGSNILLSTLSANTVYRKIFL